MTVSGAEEKDEKVQVAILLHAIGEEALEVYNTLDVDVGEDGDLTVSGILDAFKAYCLPRKNTVFERHQFWAHPMKKISIEKYVTELRQKSKDCEFGASENDMIRDKIVFSLNDQRLKERLLREPNLTLERAIDTCRASDTAKAQIQAMGAANQEKAMHVLHKRKPEDQQLQNKIKQQPAQWTQSKAQNNTCRDCGKSHQPRQCPAYGVACYRCGKQNHYARMCGTGQIQTRKTVHKLDAEIDALFIGTVNTEQPNAKTDKSWFSSITVNNTLVQFKLDTGAEANVLPFQVFKSMVRKARRGKRMKLSLKPTETMLTAYGGARLKPEGMLILTCSTARAQAKLTFYVSKHSSVPILGRAACEHLSLIKRVEVDTLNVNRLTTKEDLLIQHPTVFDGLGEFDGEYHIHIDPNITPALHLCRKIPLAIMDRLKDTLNSLLQADVITRVTEPTSWVNSLVVTVKKDRNKLRVCLDPSDLNKAILRQHYSIPTTDEVLSKLAGKKIFSVLDEKDGYWQVKLDEASSLLCTFNTPWGRYRFKRLSSESNQQVKFFSNATVKPLET